MIAMIRNLIAAVVAVPLAGYLWVISGPQDPLTISNERLASVPPIHVGDFVQFEHNVYKPWWSVRFCVAMRAVVHMIDSVGSIRDAEIMAPKNFNDGTINVFRYDVSISRMAAPGPMKIQVVGTYNCLGVTRLIYGDPLKIELYPAL